MGRYILRLDQNLKELNIELHGTFSEQDGLNSVIEYEKTISGVDTSQYKLHIDCRRLNVAAPEVVPILDGCFVMFKRDRYLLVRLTLENNPLLKMQLARLGNKAGLKQLEIVSSVIRQ